MPLIDGGTVRKVEAAEALQMGLCNRVVPTGEVSRAAIALGGQRAGFPQQTMLADRAGAYAQWDRNLPSASHQEWQRGKVCIGQALVVAAQFAGGAG